MITSEDMEWAAVVFGNGSLSLDKYNDLITAYYTQPEPPIMAIIRDRLI